MFRGFSAACLVLAERLIRASLRREFGKGRSVGEVNRRAVSGADEEQGKEVRGCWKDAIDELRIGARPTAVGTRMGKKTEGYGPIFAVTKRKEITECLHGLRYIGDMFSINYSRWSNGPSAYRADSA